MWQWTKTALGTLVVLMLLVLLAACAAPAGPGLVSPPPSPTPTPPRERGLEAQPVFGTPLDWDAYAEAMGQLVEAGVTIPEPELKIGTPVDWDVYIQSVSPRGVEMATAAATDECAELPLVDDVRSAEDPSLSVLPRLEEGDYQTLKDFYKFEEDYTYGCQRANNGQRYWDLHAVEFKCGPAILQPQTWNADESKASGILAFNNWPGAEQFPVAVDPPYSQYGVAGWTGVGGSVGWPYGGESHIGPDGGPYMVWVSSDPAEWTDRRVGSDAFRRIGWWDNHCTPNPIYKDRRKAGDPVPVDGYMMIYVDEYGRETGYIPFQTELPPVDVRLLILRSPEGADLGHVPWRE